MIGPIAWNYLPPDFPGGKQSGGLKPPADIDFLQKDQGDLALAQEYLKKAGFADGKYKGDPIFMPATNADPGKKMAEVMQAQLEKLGFKVNARFLPQNTLYTKYCNSGQSNYDICPNVGFFKDFLDGAVADQADVLRPGDHPAEQHQLAAARRPERQQADRHGQHARSRARRATRHGPTRTSRSRSWRWPFRSSGTTSRSSRPRT